MSKSFIYLFTMMMSFYRLKQTSFALDSLNAYGSVLKIWTLFSNICTCANGRFVLQGSVQYSTTGKAYPQYRSCHHEWQLTVLALFCFFYGIDWLSYHSLCNVLYSQLECKRKQAKNTSTFVQVHVFVLDRAFNIICRSASSKTFANQMYSETLNGPVCTKDTFLSACTYKQYMC